MSKRPNTIINPSTNHTIKSLNASVLENVPDFKYLGAYCDTDLGVKTRIVQGWSALNKLNKIWKSNILQKIKVKLFQTTVKAILTQTYGKSFKTCVRFYFLLNFNPCISTNYFPNLLLYFELCEEQGGYLKIPKSTFIL